MTEPFGEFKTKAEAVLVSLRREFAQVRTNRPTPALVEDLKVEYYGQKLPVKQVGSLSIEPPRDILIQVWDKEAVGAVVKAIEASTLGLSAVPQGNLIRVHLPALSAERRTEIIKHVKRLAENHRIQLRHLRDETNKIVQKLEGTGGFDEDAKFKTREKVQEETERVNKEIENLLLRKIREIES